MSGPGPRASELFLALADVPASERAAWLDLHCAGDPELRGQVEALLASLDAPDDFLDPAALHPRVIDADTPLAPGTRVAEFTIQGVIGTGSAGIVYIAQQKHPQRTVALKVLRRGLAASSARRRFEMEAELLGQLQHPGIAQIYAAHPGDETIPPFIAMELVEGPPISKYVAEHQLDVRGKIELMIRVCDAVQHAHQRGVIHRDLKPANVLVGRDGTPKILDFGVARRSGAAVAISSATTEIGQLVGTLAFMSPEQVTAVPSEVDTRSDIYALGVILFRLLAGRLPFTHDDPPLHELARRIAFEEAPRLAEVDPSLAGDLDTIVATALAKDKERRYGSAADLAADLRRWVAGGPIAAAEDSATYDLRDRVVRYRRTAAAAVLASITLGLLAAFAFVERSRAERANVRLRDELSTGNVARARLLGITGNLRDAEEVLWHEFFERPDSLQARWALWELYARQPSLWTRTPHSGGTTVVRLDPAGDRLLSAGADGRVRIVERATGRVRQALDPAVTDVVDLDVIPSTGSVVAGSGDGVLHVWDAEGRLVRRIEGTASRILSVAPVDRDVVAVLDPTQVRFWSVGTGDAVGSLALDERPTKIDAVPDRRWVVVGTERGTVLLWDLASGTVRWRVRTHRAGVSAIVISPDGSLVASSADGAVALHDGASGEVRHMHHPAAGTGHLLAFDAQGRHLAVGGGWRTALLEIGPSGLRQRASFAEPSSCMDLSRDASLLVTCSDRTAGPVRAWQIGADSRIAGWHALATRIVGLGSTGNVPTIISASTDGTMRMQGLSGSTPPFVVTHPDGLVGAQFDEAGAHVLAASPRGDLLAWEVTTGARRASVKAAPDASAFAVSDGRTVIVGGRDGGVSAWLWTGADFERRYASQADGGEALGIAIRGDFAAVAHRERRVSVHDLHRGEVRQRVATERPASSVAWSPDGRLLAVGTSDGAIEIWDPAAGARVRTLRMHSGVIAGLAWSADSGLLASGSGDGSVRLWDVERGQDLATLVSRDAGVSRVRMLPRDHLLVGYEDGVVEVHDLSYFFRHVAGQAEHQREALQRGRGGAYPRGQEVIEWSTRLLR